MTDQDREVLLVALYDFTARVSNELSFQKGETISLLEEHESGMWKGRHVATGAVGFFPYNYTALEDAAASGLSLGSPSDGRNASSGVRSGWVIKRGGRVKNWRVRWFVLQGDELSYFKQKEDEKPAGVIRLTGATVAESDVRPQCFTVTSYLEPPVQGKPVRQRTFYLVAESHSALDAWVSAIQAAIAQANDSAQV
jgi:hypothetical protein